MKKIIYITWASWSWKTTTIKHIEDSAWLEGVSFYYFDSIWVPSFEEMVEKFGSWEERQRQITIERTLRMLEDGNDICILDWQMRPSFIVEAMQVNWVVDWSIILIDCNDEVRTKRLISRWHPELVNFDMMNRAKYLREETTKGGWIIIDNSELTIEETASEIQKII